MAFFEISTLQTFNLSNQIYGLSVNSGLVFVLKIVSVFKIQLLCTGSELGTEEAIRSDFFVFKRKIKNFTLLSELKREIFEFSIFANKDCFKKLYS